MIPIFRPTNTPKTEQLVLETLRSGWWGMGPKTEQFEREFAHFVGAEHAVGVNSATAGLDLAIKAFYPDKKYLITSAMTFISTALAGLYNGQEVILIDIDPETLNMDWSQLAQYESILGDAFVVPVHYGGRNAYYNAAGEMVGMPDFPAIQDCAHATGTTDLLPGPKVWSFHAVKNLPMGDGGAITTDDAQAAEHLKQLRWVGINKSTWDRSSGEKRYGWDYDIQEVGYKAHMNDLTASIGLAQLEYLPEGNDIRKLYVERYRQQLDGIDWLKLPPRSPDSAWHMFVVQLDPSVDRNAFIDYMNANGVAVGVHYKPLNQYPMFSNAPLPNVDRVWQTIVTLPLFPSMTVEEHDKVCNLIKDFKCIEG